MPGGPTKDLFDAFEISQDLFGSLFSPCLVVFKVLIAEGKRRKDLRCFNGWVDMSHVLRPGCLQKHWREFGFGINLHVLYNVKWRNANSIYSSHGMFTKNIKTIVFFFSNLEMTYLSVLPTFCPSCPRVLCFCNFLTRSHCKPPPSLDSLTSNWPQSVYKADPAMLVELC